MKAHQTDSPRESFRSRFFLLLIVAVLSPASLVCAQSTTTARTSSGGGRFSAEDRTRNRQVAIANEKQQESSKPRKRPDGPGQMVDPNDGSSLPGTVVGSGTPVKHLISLTQSLTFSDPNSSSVIVTVPGAQLTDLVMIGVPDSTSDKFIFRAAVSADGKVKVSLHTGLPHPHIQTQPILCRIVVIGF